MPHRFWRKIKSDLFAHALLSIINFAIIVLFDFPNFLILNLSLFLGILPEP